MILTVIREMCGTVQADKKKVFNGPNFRDFMNSRKFAAGHHGLIKYRDAKSKCCHLKKLPVQIDCGRCLSVWGPLHFKGFLGWSSNFVGCESGQIKSLKLLQNIVSNRTQHPPHPPSRTLSGYIVLLWHTDGGRGGGGELNQREG